MIIAIFLLQAAVQADTSMARWGYFKPLVEALSENKATISVSYSRGIGFVALKDIQKGELILTISVAHMLTCLDSFPFAAAFSDLDCSYRLFARVMYDRWVNPSPGLPTDYSRYSTDYPDIYPLWDRKSQEYMHKAMPTLNETVVFLNYNSMKPIFLARIRGIPMIEQICKECVTEEAFNWVFGLIESRGRQAGPLESLVTGLKLEPKSYTVHSIIDFYNHHPLPRSTQKTSAPEQFIGDPTTHVQLFADRFTPRGSEIFISYGRDTTSNLFLRHGFVLRHSPDDFISIGLDGDESCPDRFFPDIRLCLYRMFPGTISQSLLLLVRKTVRKGLPDPPQGYSLIPDSLPHFYNTLPDTSDSQESKWTLLQASLSYRFVVLNQSFHRCSFPYRLTIRRLASGKYASDRIKRVDQLCASAWETQFGVLKSIDRFLLFVLVREAGFRRS